LLSAAFLLRFLHALGDIFCCAAVVLFIFTVMSFSSVCVLVLLHGLACFPLMLCLWLNVTLFFSFSFFLFLFCVFFASFSLFQQYIFFSFSLLCCASVSIFFVPLCLRLFVCVLLVLISVACAA